MTFTYDQFMQMAIAFIFLAIAIAAWLASFKSRIIDVIVGVIVFVIIAWVLLSTLVPMLHF